MLCKEQNTQHISTVLFKSSAKAQQHLKLSTAINYTVYCKILKSKIILNKPLKF